MHNYCYLHPGLLLSLPQRSSVIIPNDGSERILITDIGHNSRTSLLCSSIEVEVMADSWYLHPTERSIFDDDKINSSGAPDRGWHENMHIDRLQLWRDSGTIAEEGVFTCNIVGDNNSPASVGIYYKSKLMNANRVGIFYRRVHVYPPVQSVSANIIVVSQREGTFKVQCTSRGGRALRMTVTGPGDFTPELDNIQAVGTAQRVGNDSFYGTTDVISRQNDMDSYWCTSSNGLSFTPRNNTRLRG